MTTTKAGFLLIDKPVGPTSFDVVRDVRRLADIRKVGHAGTLDPKATGLLAVALGRCTRLLQYVDLDHKKYRFTVRLGQGTETHDTEGEVVDEAPFEHVQREDVEAALPQFVGTIEQVPPAYSAVKVDGERAYERARSGEDVELDARRVEIRELELLSCELPHLELQMECGSGTYVRSLARDLSRELDTVGHTTAIRRLEVGSFGLDEATTLDDLTVDEIWEDAVSPLEMVRCLDRVEADDAQREDIGHGRPIEAEGDWEVGEFVAGHDGEGNLLAVLECTEPGQLWPRRVMI